MKVYIAASSREPERVRAAQDAVHARGWTITADWYTPIAERAERGLTDADLSDPEAAGVAHDCLDALARAEVLWYLCPTQPTRGAYVELGVALAWGMPIVCSGARTSIFEAPGLRAREDMPSWLVATDEDALARLDAIAKGAP